MYICRMVIFSGVCLILVNENMNMHTVGFLKQLSVSRGYTFLVTQMLPSTLLFNDE